MKKIAIISDIHSNLAAFNAVLEDIDKRSVDAIYCLGDVVGYGPNPVECFRKAMKYCQIIIKGNHEEGIVEGVFGVTSAAKDAMLWTRKLMRPSFYSLPRKKKTWDYLCSLPLSFCENKVLFVHGAPQFPTHEYLTKNDTFDVFDEIPKKIAEAFSLIDHLCFVGHTHTPGIITEDSKWYDLEDFDYEWEIDSQQKLICNVGSVGQPRDRDVRSCYAIYDGQKICYYRVPYDIKVTQQKIKAIPALHDYLAERLEFGR